MITKTWATATLASEIALEVAGAVPLAAHATWEGRQMHLASRVSMPDGSRGSFAEASASVSSVADALALGETVARSLEAQGARAVVNELAAARGAEPAA